MRDWNWYGDKYDDYPGANDVESIERYVKYLLIMRKRRNDFDIEAHKRDDFELDFPLTAESQATLSGFLTQILQTGCQELFCIASTITVVALFKGYVALSHGYDDGHECVKAFKKV